MAETPHKRDDLAQARRCWDNLQRGVRELADGKMAFGVAGLGQDIRHALGAGGLDASALDPTGQTPADEMERRIDAAVQTARDLMAARRSGDPAPAR